MLFLSSADVFLEPQLTHARGVLVAICVHLDWATNAAVRGLDFLLVAHQEMTAIELDQPTVGDPPRHLSRPLDRRRRVVDGVQDEGRRRDPLEGISPTDGVETWLSKAMPWLRSEIGSDAVNTFLT